MKEHPILMSTPMVQAILEGRKSQTRRVLKDQPAFMDKCYYTAFRRDFGGRKCPYGRVGDRLWVREIFCDDCPSAREDENGVCYKANRKNQPASDFCTKWKPSIFMPRKLSRITLEITDIKVQRLWEITEEDCVAEGLKLLQGGIVSEYAVLWNKINGKKHHWKDNHWVWVIEFKRIVCG
jgi:hypothetical protein